MTTEHTSNGSSPRPSSKSGAKAAKKNEIANRRLKVAELALARIPQQEIAKTLGVSTGSVSVDLKALRAEWRIEHREKIDQAQERELAALAKDERRIRQRIALLKQDDHKNLVAYQRVILEIMERRSKILGTDAAIKIEAKNETRVVSSPYTVDVAKILADPEATERLLDAVQRPALPKGSVTLETLIEMKPAENGSGAGHIG